jgi:hypothetical protein
MQIGDPRDVALEVITEGGAEYEDEEVVDDTAEEDDVCGPSFGDARDEADSSKSKTVIRIQKDTQEAPLIVVYLEHCGRKCRLVSLLGLCSTRRKTR